MSQRTLTSLLAVALVAVVGGVWWGLRSIDGEVETAGVGSVARGAQAPSENDPSDAETRLAEVERFDDSRAESSAVSEEFGPQVEGVSAARRGWWRVPKGSVWVRGRVELPVGTPLDEELWVTAEGSIFKAGGSGRKSHSSKVEDDGTFSVAFSSETKRKGRLTLQGRYLYLSKSHWVSMTDEEERTSVELTPRLGGCLRVRVLPPRAAAMDARALEGVDVDLRQGGFMSQKLRDGRLLELGEYEIGGVPPDSPYEVHAITSQYANGHTDDVSVAAGEVESVDVALSLGARISGTVLDHLGNPINAATVVALTASKAASRNPFMKPAPEGEAETSVGRFELVGVPAGETILVASAEGHLDTDFDLGELTDGVERTGLTIRLDRGGVVGGVVRWPDGTPAQGASVRIAQGDDMGNFDVERVKGEMDVGPDGLFEFPALLEGACNLTAGAIHPDDMPDLSSKLNRMRLKHVPRWMARVEGVLPGAQSVTLTLSPGNAVTGTVVDDQGKPVKAFQVTASPEGNSMLTASSMRPVRGRFKDKEGKFMLEGVQPGRWEVRVSATGYGDSERMEVSVPGAGPLRFMVPRTGMVSGVVRGPSGKPALDARVQVVHGKGKTAAVTAEDDGTFVLGKIEPGRIEVFADSSEYGRSDSIEFDLGPRGKREGLVVELREGARLAVEIHDSDPDREGRRITLTGPGTRAERTSDAQGRAEFEGLDEGSFEVQLVTRSGRRPRGGPRGGGDDWMLAIANRKSAKVTLTSGETVDVVLGGPSPDAVEVTGVVSKAGEPVASALVTASRIGSEDSSGQRPEAGVRANDLGEYTLVLDEPGEWRFYVGSDFASRVAFDESVPVGKQHQVDFRLPERRIAGELTGPGGEPLGGVRVSLVSAEMDASGDAGWFGQRFAQSDDNGLFEFEQLTPGKYNLRAGGSDNFGFAEKGADYGRAVVQVEVKEDQELIEVDVRLRRAGKIKGIANDAYGEPVRFARITVTDEEGLKLSRFGSVRSGVNGAFEYSGVAPGTYFVSGRLDGDEEGLESQPQKVRVYEDGAAEVLLRLE